MKNNYNIINIFADANEKTIKEKINAIIKKLCAEEVEKISNMDYNIDVIAKVDTSNCKKEEVSGV